MTPLFKKLNYKNESEILIMNHPQSFDKELESIRPFANIVYSVSEKTDMIRFTLLFVTGKDEIDKLFDMISPKLIDDATLWFCYPKGTSKKYKSTISRDKGWETLGNYGFEPIRLVSIDEDWSALRFRKVENIKTLTRSFAISEEGKRRTSL